MATYTFHSMIEHPQNIAAFLPNWLGDVAMSTPALRALRTRFPEAKLTVVGRPGALGLLRHIPWLDAWVDAPRGTSWSAIGELRAQLNRPDLAVLFPHSFRAAFLARASGAKRIVGYARGGRSLLLTDPVPPHRENGSITPIYMADEYATLVESIGCDRDDQGLELHASDAAIAHIQSQLKSGGPLIGFAPGAAFGPSKCWLPERYAAVADALHERFGARCALLTGPGEEKTRDAVQAAARKPLLTLDDGAPTLDTLLATISQLDLFIGNDSGPRHIAIAFDIPVVCIMGPTSPRYSCGPYERGTVLRVDVDCGPCQKPTCATDHRCMTRIKVESVVAEAAKLLPGDTLNLL